MIRTLIIFLAFLLFGCTTPGPSVEQQLQDAIYKYKTNGKPQKALAWGADRRGGGGGVLGYAFEMADLESARQKALSNCNENGFKKNMPVMCVLIYENDDYVSSYSPVLLR